MELALDVHGQVIATRTGQRLLRHRCQPCCSPLTLRLPRCSPGTAVCGAPAGSARAAGGGNLGSGAPANAGQAGAVVGGVARRHGAPEFRVVNATTSRAAGALEMAPEAGPTVALEAPTHPRPEAESPRAVKAAKLTRLALLLLRRPGKCWRMRARHFIGYR